MLNVNPSEMIPATPAPGVLAVIGPDGYISPDWYGAPDQVPTWNYIAVHLRGQVVPGPDLQQHLNDLSDAFEARLAPKPIWRSSKMAAGVMDRMMRMIQPFRLIIDQVDGTWKLGQNKTSDMRAGAVAALGAAEIAKWMSE